MLNARRSKDMRTKISCTQELCILALSLQDLQSILAWIEKNQKVRKGDRKIFHQKKMALVKDWDRLAKQCFWKESQNFIKYEIDKN